MREVAEFIRAAGAARSRDTHGARSPCVRIVGAGHSAVRPGPGDVSPDLSRCVGILDLRPDDLVVEALAGTSLADVDAALREHRRRLPLRPWTGSRSSCPPATLGGAVAAGADGLTAREGFRWRDVLHGATLALGNGELVRGGASVVKSVAGFDVPRLLPASRGELGVILSCIVRCEPVPEVTAAFRRASLSLEDVAPFVAGSVALGQTLRGLVLTQGSGPGDVVADALLEGSAGAVATGRRRLRDGGFEDVEDAETRWAALTDLASRPAPSGLHRRATPLRGDAVLPADDVRRAGGWTADLLRRRVFHWSAVPHPAPDAATALLAGRVRAAFDPDGVFRPGHGWGAP